MSKTIPSQAAGRRLLVENISNENLTLFSGVLLTAGSSVDIFIEDPTITDERALSDMENPLGSLYIETTVNNRVRIVDFDPTSIARPEVVYGNNNRIVFRRDQVEAVGASSESVFAETPSTIYVDSVNGNDANLGDVGNPLKTLVEVRRRIPNDDGTYTVMCVGAGPYANPGGWPTQPTIEVIADTSSPVASKNPARFTATGGALNRTSQKEDTSFGAIATTVGTHWYSYFFNFFGLFQGYSSGACLTRPSGTIGIVELSNSGLEGFEEQCDIYEWTTTLVLESADTAKPGGAYFRGFILTSNNGGGITTDGYDFYACRCDLTELGNLLIRNGTYNGYITGNSSLILGEGGSASAVYMGTSSRIVGEQGGALRGVVDNGSNRIRLTGDCVCAYYDLENSSGIEVGGASRIIMRSGYLNNPSKFIRPRSYSSGNPTMARAVIQFVDPVTGTCVDGIELINGTALIQNGNLSGLTASNYDVRLDGVDFAFGAEGFSLDTGGFTR